MARKRRMKIYFMQQLTIGLTHTSTLRVTSAHLAQQLGSGDLPVLGTPAMLALMENAAMLAVAPCLPESSTTVGGQIESTHLIPTALDREVRATAHLVSVDGRKLTFRIVAHDEQGGLLGEGTHIRFIVDRERFMGRL